MVGLIFGILIVIIGIVLASIFTKSTESSFVTDPSGRYVRDEAGNRVEKISYPLRKFVLPVLLGAIILGAFVISLGCITSVDTGHVGIVTTFGRVENYTYDSGIHFKAPWRSVIEMDNRVQKATVQLPCFSADIQEVNTVYTVNYQISKTNAQDLYRTVGVNYLETVLNPAIQESVKTIMARYTAENLIGQRDALAKEIEEFLGVQLSSYNIEVVSSAIEDMDFTDSFTNAVESKQVAAQNKLQAQIEQEQKTMEAQQAAERSKIEAAAAAEVSKIQAQADMEVAKISADSAEYQGKKEAAISLQRLASINGWTAVTNPETDINELYKANGDKVTDNELLEGSQKLIEYYYTQAWDGKLPETFVGKDDIANVILSNK